MKKQKEGIRQTLNKKLFNFRGVKFRAWMYFALFSFILLTFMSVLQMLMYRASFLRVKEADNRQIVVALDDKYKVCGQKKAEHETAKQAETDYIKNNLDGAEVEAFQKATKEAEAAEAKAREDFRTALRDAALVNGINLILLFKTQESETGEVTKLARILDSSPDPSSNSKWNGNPNIDGALKLDIEDALRRLEKEMSRMFILESTDHSSKLIFIARSEVTEPATGAESAEEYFKVFYYMESASTMSAAMTQSLIRQLFLSILICALLSLFVSVFLSGSLSRPVVKLTASAEQLAAGNYEVRFDASGYGEYEQLAETLNFATTEMKSTENLRKDLIANISHELRTPLTMVKAYAEMIRDHSGENPKKRGQHLQIILDETDRLSALVSDILDLSRLEAETSKPDKTLFDLSGLVGEVATRFQGVFGAKGYIVEIKLSGVHYVVADRKRIAQVVYNLISNALNYVGEDKKIFVEVAQSGSEVVFSVSDHGDGIDEEVLPHIWDRYFRSAEAKRTKVGTGIGLSIVKQICQQHGIPYGVESKKGEGARFYVRFERVEKAGDE